MFLAAEPVLMMISFSRGAVGHIGHARPMPYQTDSLTLRTGYSPADSRSSDAATATPPRRARPALSMFLAAFSSRSSTSPHSGFGQTWVRMDRLLRTRLPQPLQSWLV